MTNNSKSERIYITAKTRMVAEKRMRSLNGFLHVLIAWFSFCLIAVSVANLADLLTVGVVDFAATLMAIALFGTSLFLLGGRISQRAEEYRKCYLSLKAIYHSADNEEKKISDYDKVLADHPNHEPIDYDIMIVDADSRGQRLWNDEGDIVATDPIKARVQRHRRLELAFKCLGVILPGLVIATAYGLSGNIESSSGQRLEAQAVTGGN